MASVGVLAAVVNIVVLLIVAVVDRIIELVVRNFAASRLQKERRAPIVHDSDTWLPNIPRSVVKYRRHPGVFTNVQIPQASVVKLYSVLTIPIVLVLLVIAILITVIFTVFLIASEIVTELGVDVSNTCSPEKKSGKVITRGDSTNRFTEVELGTSTFFLQSITFLDGDLVRVPSGLPRSIKGTECIVCMEPNKYPDIMNGCSITDGKSYEPGQLSVTIVTTTGPFKTITESMVEIGGSGRTFKGKGDLTNNGVHSSAFLFYTAENGDLVYLEYSHQKHLVELVDAARNKTYTPSDGITKSRVTEKRIKCSTNQLSPKNFRDAASIYRTIQLENTINPAVFVPEENSFKSLTTNDVYRAGLSMKIIDDALTTGEYYEYTSCGQYNWVFLLPIIFCTICIFVLFVLSTMLGKGFDKESIPYNSRSWFRHFQVNKAAMPTASTPLASSGSRYFGSIFDEMVILEEGRGSGMRFGLRSRDGKIAPFGSDSQSYGLSDYQSDIPTANEVGHVDVAYALEVPSDPTDGEGPSNIVLGARGAG